jgi:AcrR family transcriptional regulator
MNTVTRDTRVRDRAASERRIRAAAVSLFARHGYDQVTVRMIAAEAGVNGALINRYFGTKLNLFTAALAAEARVPDLTGVARHDLPERLAAHATRPREERPMLRALNRSQGAPEVDALLRARIEDLYVSRIAAILASPDPDAGPVPDAGPDAVHRARLAVAVLLGMNTARGIYPPADLPDAGARRHLAAAFRALLLA